jgi:hypothetical protein
MRHSRTENLVIRRYLRMGAIADTLSCWQGEVRLGAARNVSLADRVDKVQDSSAHARRDGSSTTLKRTMTLNCLRLPILIFYFHSSLQSWVEFRKYTVLWHVIGDWYVSSTSESIELSSSYFKALLLRCFAHANTAPLRTLLLFTCDSIQITSLS